MPTAVDKAINEATEEILKDSKDSDAKGEESKEKNKKEDQESESSEDSEDEESSGSDEEKSSDDDFDDVTLKEAKALYRAIKGDQGPAIIAALAQQAGLLKAETKQEVKDNVKSLSQIVTEALGPEFKMLVPQMTRMMEAVLETARAEHSVKFNEIEQQNIQQMTNSAMEKVARENKISTEQLGKMIVPLTQEFLPGANTSAETYIRGLYKQATVGKFAAQDKAKIADKARRNASDAPSRLHTAGSISEGKLPTKKMSLKESIAWAQQQIADEGSRVARK